MNREIKFRAFGEEKMHYDVDIISGLPYGEERGWGADEQTGDREIEQGILMQYTGLKDKNGVEIYEGDILFHSDGEYSIKGKVFYNITLARFMVEDLVLISEFYDDELFDFSWEVIGNIHQNS